MVPQRTEMSGGLEQPGVLDAFAHDTREDKLVLAMFEPRPWTGGTAQLAQLEQKMNSYLSFVLDGEMAESFPHLIDKPLEIQLRTPGEPSAEAWDLIGRMQEQLAFQKIEFVVVNIGGEGCGCG